MSSASSSSASSSTTSPSSGGALYPQWQYPAQLPAPVGHTPPLHEARPPLRRRGNKPRRSFFFSTRSHTPITTTSSTTTTTTPTTSMAFARAMGHASASSTSTNHHGSSTSSSWNSVFPALARVEPMTTSTAVPRKSVRKYESHLALSATSATTTPSIPAPSNVLQWLQNVCPPEILPKVLAYCGPQKTWTLMKTNRFWYHLIVHDATWKILCEELYKWQQGDELPTTTWREYYRYHPIVPIDYSSIHAALAVVARNPNNNYSSAQRHFPQNLSIRILMWPGKHYVKESLIIHCPVNVNITIETLELPQSLYQSMMARLALASSPSTSANARTSPKPLLPESAHSPARPRRAQLRHWLQGCRSNSAIDDTEVGDDEELVDLTTSLEWTAAATPATVPPLPAAAVAAAAVATLPPKRATLILRTRRHNEPLFRVRQGHLQLCRLDLHHFSFGVDIWNGNAAVQVQPPLGPDDLPLAVVPRPSVDLDYVEVVSRSGRGIVNIDGGHVRIRHCYIHDCAATGIYVGGPGSQAHIEHSDVVLNGNGNHHTRRGGAGIGRGHSGIYLEQGQAVIRDCNISRNSLTGISAISPDHAILSLEGSDLVANGTYQLELPNSNSLARRRSITRNNHLAVAGLARARSGLTATPAASVVPLDESSSSNGSSRSSSSSSSSSSTGSIHHNNDPQALR